MNFKSKNRTLVVLLILKDALSDSKEQGGKMVCGQFVGCWYGLDQMLRDQE